MTGDATHRGAAVAVRVACAAFREGCDTFEPLAVEAFTDAEVYRLMVSEALAQLHDAHMTIRSLRDQNVALRDELRRYTASRVWEAV